MESKKLVVLGMLGTNLDQSGGRRRPRWKRWRPTVSIAGFDDLRVARYELLHDPKWDRLARTVANDMIDLSANGPAVRDVDVQAEGQGGDTPELGAETAQDEQVGSRSATPAEERPSLEVRAHDFEVSDVWDFEEVYAALFDFARSYPFDTDREDYLVHITTGSHVVQICLFLLTESRHLPARLLQTSPGTSRDKDRYRIIDLDLSVYAPLKARFDAERSEDTELLKDGIATRNAAFNAMIDRIAVVASSSRAPIHLGGPTGAGKSTLARRIYALKRKRQQLAGPLVELNCATLRGDLAMSTLFGHVRGAFTGAVASRDGVLKAAHRGLLFLDEIAELGLDEQTMLLRAIEEGRFSPVGSERVIESDFQLVTGTNRDLRQLVRDGKFREDLLARIDVWAFELPGLNGRPEDIEPNLDVELERYAEQNGRRVTFSGSARRRFLAFATAPESAWSGNFRELAAAVMRMGTVAPSGLISEAGVAEEEARLRARWSGGEVPAEAGSRVSAVLGVDAEALDPFDRVQLEYVLEVCARSRSLAAAGRSLFARSREERATKNDSDRVRKYLAKFGIDGMEVISLG